MQNYQLFNQNDCHRYSFYTPLTTFNRKGRALAINSLVNCSLICIFAEKSGEHLAEGSCKKVFII